MTPELKQNLSKICQKNAFSVNDYEEYGGQQDKYDLFPYAPYIPENWNRILVLAESQQLRSLNDGNKRYRQSLLAMEDEELIFRLGNKKITNQSPEKQIGITPWDEGYLKLAMLSCYPAFTIDQFGVSNAVPWHLNKKNKAQSAFLKRKSVTFWEEILPVLKPSIIVCTGVIADSIITDTGYCSKSSCRKIHIRSASQLHFVVKKSYRYTEWLDQHLDVKEVSSKNGQMIDPQEPYRYFVWYAAHAFSKINPQLDK